MYSAMSNKLETPRLSRMSTPDLVVGAPRRISSGRGVRCVSDVLWMWESKLCADGREENL